MGNCQATDAAAAVIQHPGGRVERLYWPTPASEVMRSNPGHYVALITLCCLPAGAVNPDQVHQQPGRPQGDAATGGGSGGSGESVRFTRVRLLRPKDTLMLGQVYRLVTSQEVIKGLRARKQEKMRVQMELLKKQQRHQQQQQQQQQQQYQRMKTPSDEQDSECSLAGGRLTDSDKDSQAARQERGHHRAAAQSAGRPRQWRPSLHSISEAGS